MKKLKGKIDISRIFPSGYSYSREIILFGFGYVLSWLFSLTFYIRMRDAKSSLYRYRGTVKYLVEDRVMPDFYTLLSPSFMGFWLICLLMLVLAVIHYTYHHQGSKSIYLMRRLPNCMELHKRCLSFPLVCIFICLVSAFIALVIFYTSYMLTTPEQCLMPNQWEKLWSVIL